MREALVRCASRRPWAVVLAATICTLSFSVLNGHPIQYVIPRGDMECLYDKLEEEEYLTMSLFISQGERLDARAIMEGPVAEMKAENALNIYQDITAFDRGSNFGKDRLKRDRPTSGYEGVGQKGTLNLNQLVSFEFGADDDDDDFDEDDDYEAGGRRNRGADDDERMNRREALMKQKNDRRMQQKRKKENLKLGFPWEKTIKIYAAGWYRVCVKSFTEITVEFDLRKSSDLGPPPGDDDVHGHIPALDAVYEHYQYDESEEEEMDAAEIKDLEEADEVVQQLHALLKEMEEHQSREDHRVEVHYVTNNHSLGRIIMGSFVETLLFVGVTGFQVYTIRKWFAGGPLLGR